MLMFISFTNTFLSHHFRFVEKVPDNYITLVSNSESEVMAEVMTERQFSQCSINKATIVKSTVMSMNI